MNSKTVFIKGQEYKLKYTKSRVSRRFRNGEASEFSVDVITGNFEYIGNRGSKYHFFENNQGIDLFLNRSEVEEFIQNAL
jgi:hypothetical protein